MNPESTSSLALDRLSSDELVRRGLAQVFPVARPAPSPEPEEDEQPAFRLVNADIPGTIYVLQAPPLMPVKIGFTRAERVEYRLTGLQTGCPYPLRVIARATGLPAQERRLHALLDAYRLTGEWFEWTPIVREVVDAIQAGRLPD